MANKSLFKSLVGKLIPAADARNEHGAPAYQLTPKQALAQYAATGCLGATFYAGAEEQLAKVLRSEEHTSELQSRQYLVCRLLLEKKKQTTRTYICLWSSIVVSPRI